MSIRTKGNRGPSAAAENRAALLEAARAVFEERGPDAPLSLVAKRAGVGQGSLYRHFPDRIAIAVAVMDANMADIEAAAADPGATMRDVMDLITHQSEGAAALIEISTRARDDHRLEPLNARLRTALETVLARAQASGEVGHHVGVDELLLSVTLIAGAMLLTPTAQRSEVAHKAWELISPALDPRPTSPPQTPLQR